MMLALHKSLVFTHNPQKADRLTREVASTDMAIDELVASRQLSRKGMIYELTEDEVKIMEGK